MSDVKIFAEVLDESAERQIDTLAALPPFEKSKIRIMADAHAGKGCTIGFTANLGTKVIPNVVGVDIGCGVLAVQFERKVDEAFLEELDRAIIECVPCGFDVHKGRRRRTDLTQLKCHRGLTQGPRIERSLGTLGGGNHFIEVDVGADDKRPWLVIHSGSRNLGKQVAEHYQDMAEQLHKGDGLLIDKKAQIIAEYKAQGRKKEIQPALDALFKHYRSAETDVPKDLCWLDGVYAQDYLHDMKFAQRFACDNRAEMAGIIIDALGLTEIRRIESVHNYIDDENITRKGAISAHAGEEVLIPLNMAEGMVIGHGLGNPDYNESAPHGAGRLMSRSEAFATLSMDDFEKSMEGIYTTSVDETTLDEAPSAYKPAASILKSLAPTVEVEELVRPVYNFKASKLRKQRMRDST